MKLNFTLLIATLFFCSITTAQTYTRCSAMQYQDYLVSEGLAQPDQLSQMDQAIQQWIDNNPDNGNDVITIPVVFHVLYANPNQNIPDARIFAQLDVLNKDYSRTNADAINTPALFLPVAANSEVQFCLATQDPNGLSTTGIIRKSSSNGTWSQNNYIKSTSNGGSDAWNTTKYLNIWIGNLSSGILGWATFPNSAGSSNDGVVVHYRSVGGPNSNDIGYAPYHLGRTLTHEVGHWLGLYHTFQQGCSGTSSSNCLSGGDQVCDTPPASNENYGCPSNLNSCTETPTDLPDMVTNYMDYTDDPCMNVFTNGQKTRMHAVLNTSRFSMLNSAGCLSVGISSIEALNSSVNIFPSPSTGIFNINTSFSENTSMNIYVFNMLGEKVLQLEKKNLMKSNLEIDLSDFGTGIYNVVFESNGFTTNRKVNVLR